MTPDPFTLLEEMLWNVVEQSGPLTSAIKLNNRHKFHGTDETPIRNPIQTKDLPDLYLYPRSVNFNQPGTGVSSSSCSAVANYSFLLTTASLRTNLPNGTGLNRLRWEMFVAFERARFSSAANIPKGLYGLDFLRILRIGNFASQTTDLGELGDRSPPLGWSCVMDFEATLVFNREEVIK